MRQANIKTSEAAVCQKQKFKMGDGKDGNENSGTQLTPKITLRNTINQGLELRLPVTVAKKT